MEIFIFPPALHAGDHNLINVFPRADMRNKKKMENHHSRRCILWGVFTLKAARFGREISVCKQTTCMAYFGDVCFSELGQNCLGVLS